MLKTPTQILDDHPGLKKIWNTSDVGYLLRLKLVRGKKFHRGCMVEERDILKVFSLVPHSK